MSTLAATNLKNASSGSNNIVLGTDGSTTITTLNGTTITGTSVRGVVTSGTAVASTSGTSIDFTGIPSWVKRVTVMFNGVSTSGTNSLLFQIGISSGVVTTGYSGSGVRLGATSLAGANFTNGLGLNTTNAAGVYSGHLIWTNVSGNIWIGSANIGEATSGGMGAVGGSTVTLSGTLDRVRITTVNGTDTFDAGSINILYEG